MLPLFEGMLSLAGILLAEVGGMLRRFSVLLASPSMLPLFEGMLSLTGMLSLAGILLAEVGGMLRRFSVLLASPSMLPLFEGMLPGSVSAMLKNSASAAFTPAEYIKPFLDISPFC
jgi:hypothetical protein